MLLGPRSIAVSHRVVLCIAQFPGGSVGPVRIVGETEACSLCPDDSVLGGNGRYTPLRRDATNALRKKSTATGIPLSPSVPSARQTHSGSDCVPATSGAWPCRLGSPRETPDRTCRRDRAAGSDCVPESPNPSSLRFAPAAPSTAGPDTA